MEEQEERTDDADNDGTDKNDYFVEASVFMLVL